MRAGIFPDHNRCFVSKFKPVDLRFFFANPKQYRDKNNANSVMPKLQPKHILYGIQI